MQRIKMNGFARFLVLVAMAMFVLPLGPGISLADKAPAIKMKHKPIKYYVPEKRIRLEAKVKSEDKVDIVRCYFKGETHADYVFVPMAPLKEGLYSAILPAPSVDSEVITYLFLVVTDKNDVFRTQEYNIEKRDEDKTPAWQAIESEGNIHVSTELAEAPSMVAGFTDSIVVDVVESAARFGFVTYGIYTASQIGAAGGTTGSAATATGSGVVTATAGMSTAGVVGIGLGTAVVLGGAAAAGVALSNSDDDSSPVDPDVPVDIGDATPQHFVGTYSNRDPNRSTSEWRAITTLNEGGSGSWQEWNSGQQGNGNLEWSWDQSTSQMTINYLTGAFFSGTVSGNTHNFTLSGRWSSGAAGTVIFTRQ